MQLSLQNFSTLVANMAASAQGACTTLLDVTVGSVLRALIESSASIALWLQYLILQVLSMTRLSTSSGADADSWVADFGLTRLPPISAVGSIVMTSFSPSAQPATIPTGALVKTGDGSQSFVVIGGPYLRPQGTASITVPVEALVAGKIGNVQMGSISLLGTAIPGIDTVTNLLPLTGGAAAEVDQALRARFVTYLNTRSQATEEAIVNAIASVQQGLSYVVQENITFGGIVLPGHFTVIVDDGSGNPPPALLTAIFAAIDQVRPIGSSFSVNAPVLLSASVFFLITTVDPKSLDRTRTAISSTVTDYINGLPVGQALRFSRLSGLAYDASANVMNVVATTLNNGTTDVGGQAGAVVRSHSITITAS